MRRHLYYRRQLPIKRIRWCDPTGGVATATVLGAIYTSAGVGTVITSGTAAAIGTTALAVGGTVAAGAMSAYGKREEGIAASNQYRYAASVMDRQAEAARRTADINRGQVVYGASQQAKSLSEKVAEVSGAQKAAIGANIGGGSVTGADIIRDTATKAKQDELAIRYNADVRNWGIENEAQNEIWSLGIQKDQYLKAAKNARQAGNIGAMTSLLSTASSTASAYGKYNYKGVV